MLISFIILEYNQIHLVNRILNSIYYSNIPSEEYEIIISSNNSTIFPINQNIKIINNFAPKNQSKSRNLAINIAKGTYVVFLDGDDYFIPINLYKLYKTISNKIGFDIFFQKRFFDDVWVKKINDCVLNNVKSAGICHYVVSTNYLFKNNIAFEENKYYYYSEDIPFFIKLLDYNYSSYCSNITHYYGRKCHTSTNYKDVNIKEMQKYYVDMFTTYGYCKNNDILKKLILIMISFIGGVK